MKNAIRIVILGGGFSGISTAKELSRLTQHERSSIELHLLSDENYFVFQPLLPEVVSCSVEASHVLSPIRHLCHGVIFHRATIQHVDLERRTITFAASDIRRTQKLAYDHLVWCLGMVSDVSKIRGMADHSFPLKTLGDAFYLRNHILRSLEEAELENDERRRKILLTFIVVGGGFSGVEIVGTLNDMLKENLRYYPRGRRTAHKMVLVHLGPSLLPELQKDVGAAVQQKLQNSGIEVLLNVAVTEATSDGVTLSSGEMIRAGTVISTVGNAPHPLVRMLGVTEERGRIVVDQYLRVMGNENVWAVGDAALVPNLIEGGFCPPTGQFAAQEGRHCARNIYRRIHAEQPKPFKFRSLGQLSLVGHHDGVGKLLGIPVSGPLGWLLWRSVYLIKIPGFRQKLRIMTDWFLELLFPRDVTMIDLVRTQHVKRAHFRKGDVILRQGETADYFYVIESGEVEILREESGCAPKPLGHRGTGQSFGEIALLKDVPRTATVRCLTPVDVIKLTKPDFKSIVQNHSSLKNLLENEIAGMEDSTKLVQRDDLEQRFHDVPK